MDSLRNASIDHARRRWLTAALGAGCGLSLGSAARAQVRQIAGQVFINGRPAESTGPVNPGDEILTGPEGTAAFVIGQDAFLVRPLTAARFEQGAGASLIAGLRLLSGGIMAVFGRGQPKLVRTATVTAGIRGTGIYLEATPHTTYFCTCYGAVDLTCVSSGAKIEVRARDHTPHHIHGQMLTGRSIVPAEVKSHHNSELAMLEGLVGRVSPLG